MVLNLIPDPRDYVWCDQRNVTREIENVHFTNEKGSLDWRGLINYLFVALSIGDYPHWWRIER